MELPKILEASSRPATLCSECVFFKRSQSRRLREGYAKGNAKHFCMMTKLFLACFWLILANTSNFRIGLSQSCMSAWILDSAGVSRRPPPLKQIQNHLSYLREAETWVTRSTFCNFRPPTTNGSDLRSYRSTWQLQAYIELIL